MSKIHTFKKTIWGFHLDGYGHVNNARYLELLEEARWELLQPMLTDTLVKKYDWMTVIAGIDINFKKPVVFKDRIQIETSLHDMSHRIIITFKQQIKKGDKLCAEAFVKMAILDPESHKPLQINDEIKSVFEALFK